MEVKRVVDCNVSLDDVFVLGLNLYIWVAGLSVPIRCPCGIKELTKPVCGTCRVLCQVTEVGLPTCQLDPCVDSRFAHVFTLGEGDELCVISGLVCGGTPVSSVELGCSVCTCL